MNAKFSKTDFDLLKQDVFSFYRDDLNNIKYQVSQSNQEREIQLLKQTIDNERFFFIVNLFNFELEQIHGVQKYLGYSEKEFTYKKYWNHVIHPGKEALKLLARQMYESLCSGKHLLKFSVQRFTSMVPLKHHNGHYILTKKTSSVFQYDVNNRLLSYIDEFTIIGDYNGEPLNPRMWFDYEHQHSAERKQMLLNTANDFERMNIFAVKEFQIARALANNPGATPAELGKQFGLKPASVYTYYKRFLEKARFFFKIDFATMAEAAAYLRKECIL